MKLFSSDWPCGPCPNEWEGCQCQCGWIYKKSEVVNRIGDDEDLEHYCGYDSCPKCGKYLHCGGCV